MRARGYRFTLVLGISTPAATYGSDVFGTQTYGQRATDPGGAFYWTVVPTGGGMPTDPSIIMRRDDDLPAFTAQIISDDPNAVPLDLTAVATATLWLRPIDSTDDTKTSFPLSIVNAAQGLVSYDWIAGPNPPTDHSGMYSGDIVLAYTSGRQLTVPTRGRLTVYVRDGTNAVAPA